MTRMTDGTRTGGRTVAAKRRRLLLASSAVGLGSIAAALFWNGGEIRPGFDCKASERRPSV
jgi:hypothetical protein